VYVEKVGSGVGGRAGSCHVGVYVREWGLIKFGLVRGKWSRD
jgi:hypothetical protein